MTDENKPAKTSYRRLLEVVCNNATAAIFILNEQQECVFMNPAAERLTGYSLSEFHGRTFHDVIHHTKPDGSLYPIEECPIDRAFPQNFQEQGEEVFVHKSGRFYPVVYTASPIQESDGIVGTIVEVRDTTDTKAREQMVADESRIIDTINRVGITIAGTLDLKRVVQAVTDATTQLTGAQFGAFFYNVIGREGESYMLYTISGVPMEAFSRFPMPRNTAVFAPTFNGEGVVRSDDIRVDRRYGKNDPYYGMPDGHLPVVSYLAVPVTSRRGEVIGGLFFGHADIGVFQEQHERMVVGVASQAAIAIDNARLYEAEQIARTENEALLATEQRARTELETANRMKDEFLATLSHELRTPLNAILGYSALLRRTEPSKEELANGMNAIERNARVQAQLIEDLLDMNRIISGRIRLDVQPLDLPLVIENALEAVRPSADAKSIRIVKVIDSTAEHVRGDPGRIQQVVWNLLSNAIKFTPKGGKVQVRLERVSSQVEITVEDTGQGISSQFLPYVFDRFRQADSSITRRHGGLGLGLSIVRQLVELHGGTVRASSAGEGHGSTFIVKLPVAPLHLDSGGGERLHPRASLPPTFRCTVDLDGIHVLVIDDDFDSCVLVQKVLEECKAKVTTATSASAAMELIEGAAFHVLVSDIGMPGEDGYDLIRRIRSHADERFSAIPAVALTAFARSEDRARAAIHGFHAHLSKPVEAMELVAIVGSVVGRAPRPG